LEQVQPNDEQSCSDQARKAEWPALISKWSKYDPAAGTQLPDLSGLPKVDRVTGPERQELEAIYFDTADLALAAGRINLRRRTGGDDAGWHLKLAGRLRRASRGTAPEAARPVLGKDAKRVSSAAKAAPSGAPSRPERTALTNSSTPLPTRGTATPSSGHGGPGTRSRFTAPF
jgi:hypothetical protein